MVGRTWSDLFTAVFWEPRIVPRQIGGTHKVCHTNTLAICFPGDGLYGPSKPPETTSPNLSGYTVLSLSREVATHPQSQKSSWKEKKRDSFAVQCYSEE